MTADILVIQRVLKCDRTFQEVCCMPLTFCALDSSSSLEQFLVFKLLDLLLLLLFDESEFVGSVEQPAAEVLFQFTYSLLTLLSLHTQLLPCLFVLAFLCKFLLYALKTVP
ncbi:hypothetical protein P3T76_015025 [Phytophthora citrophthora]|uniref:Uncharacterized protein n=1 Tax=Phytophthora citrophthora TaxID=4793 RepID=A0AAD9G0W7_9STRA|nr:hypothetical protein P3T76_015025 [Phytophthora citrophthora]